MGLLEHYLESDSPGGWLGRRGGREGLGALYSRAFLVWAA
jgi:hypothetical protein